MKLGNPDAFKMHSKVTANDQCVMSGIRSTRNAPKVSAGQGLTVALYDIALLSGFIIKSKTR